MAELTHQQECIKAHYDNLKKMNLHFGYDVTKVSKKERLFLRYKFACVDNYPGCDKLINNKTHEDFASCQVRCQYSYEYT